MKIADVEAAKHEFRKHAATIHITGGDLTITDRKLVNVLLLNAYPNLLSQKQHCIPIAFLAAMIWKEGKNDDLVKESLRKLADTSVEFNALDNVPGKPWWTYTKLVGEVTLLDGMVMYEYGTEMSKALADPNVFAVINMGIQRKFASQYALALYENCLRFKRKANKPGSGSTGEIDIATWRALLNADAPLYDEFRHFNTFVIKKAIAEINQHSDIFVTPHFTRNGRTKSHIRFDVIDNPQSTLNTVADDEADLRESELFKRCIGFQISEECALHSLRTEGPQRVAEALRITEEMASKGKVKISRTAYIAGVLKKLPATPDAAPPAPVAAPVAAPVEPVEPVGKKTADKYTPEEKAELRKAYSTEKGARLNARGSFEDARHIGEFNNWLIERG
jgi:hypothetical protein